MALSARPEVNADHSVSVLQCSEPFLLCRPLHLPVFLLACRIQNVEKRDLFVDDALLSVRVLDRWVILVDEMTLNELDGQCGLSDTTTTNDDELVLSQELGF